jgi:hypothetical protein
VVDSKYGSLWGGWCSLEPGGAFGVGCGRTLGKGGRLSKALLDLW